MAFAVVAPACEAQGFDTLFPRPPYWRVYPRDTAAFLEPLAEQGDSGAQFQLGTGHLYKRWGYNKGVDEGLRWLRKSAEAGFTRAQSHLGAYLLEEGGDKREALWWLTAASASMANDGDGLDAARLLAATKAADGVPEGVALLRRLAVVDRNSQLILGTALLEGRAVPKDAVEAMRLIEGAEPGTDHLPENLLAVIRAEGIGVPPDPRAASDAQVQYRLGVFYHRGFEVEKEARPVLAWLLGQLKLDAEQFFESQKSRRTFSSPYFWSDEGRALAWYRKAAEGGHVGARVNLGVIYFNPKSSRWNCDEGMRWTRAAAETGDPTAQVNLGSALRRGCLGLPSDVPTKDLVEAVQWFQKAADAGHLGGLFFLAGSYREGKGVPQDYARAMALYRQGFERGDWQAAQAIGNMYLAGEGVEKSQALGDEWYGRAIQLRHRSMR